MLIYGQGVKIHPVPHSLSLKLLNRDRIFFLLGQREMGAFYIDWDTILEHPCAKKENSENHHWNG